MALYAFDGTWNRSNAPEPKRTNVWRFHKAYAASNPGDAPNLHQNGVGTKYGTVGRLVGGAIGGGAKRRLRKAYRVLYEYHSTHPDEPIDIVGFSRGAAMATHFANVIAEYGLRRPRRSVGRDPLLGWGIGFDEPRHPGTVEVRFLGLWDVVASFGLVVGPLQRTNPGFKLNLPEEPVVRNGGHAMALDERRHAFTNERLTVHHGCKPDPRARNFREVWFRGVHGDVGGSGRLGSVAFCWMVRLARDAGVKLDWSGLRTVAPDPNAPIGTNLNPRIERDRTVCDGDWVHQAAVDWTGPQLQLSDFGSWKRFFTFKWKSPAKGRPIPDNVQIDTTPADCS